MKLRKNRRIIIYVCIFLCLVVSACKRDLNNIVYGGLADNNFFKTSSDVSAALSAMYTGIMEGDQYKGYGAGLPSIRAQNSATTDEIICYWGEPWGSIHQLNYTPDYDDLTGHYTILMPYISQLTSNIAKAQTVDMDATLQARYVGEFKALRAFYSEILYFYYGPVPIRTDATQVDNESAPVLPRPTIDAMVAQIKSDFTDAAAVLPDKFTGSDYGRFSKAACLTGLMKLYMHEKNWKEAITVGEQIKAMGFSLTPDYRDNFNVKAKGGNSEIILAVVCSTTNYSNSNLWLAHALPTDYYDPSGVVLTKWGGYRMPWATYNKFDPTDKRLSVLLRKYPTGKDASGNLIYVDALTRGDIGAIPMKFGVDPTGASSQNSQIDYPVFRYADVELLLAEALTQQNGGPNSEAYNLINAVRIRAGVPSYPENSQSQTQFLTSIQNERLYELWCEGTRRDDLIRWGLYVQRAINDGSSYANDSKILYPLPRTVITQSNGVIKQNPGYN